MTRAVKPSLLSKFIEKTLFSIPIYQVDAFTDKLFSGNPAAVCPLTEWLSDDVMQAIAAENNLSETAFINRSTSPFTIRWFTPITEVDLCGHATLAAARILFDEYLPKNSKELSFNSRRGLLKTYREDELIYLDFPADFPVVVEEHSLINEGLQEQPIEVLQGKDDYLAIFENEQTIRSLQPNFNVLSELESRGLIVSAPSEQVDFVSRCFFPQMGIDEDPVTGSAHTVMVPYWSERLRKSELQAIQCSPRGGLLTCQLRTDRVLIGGFTVRYLVGQITV